MAIVAASISRIENSSQSDAPDTTCNYRLPPLVVPLRSVAPRRRRRTVIVPLNPAQTNTA
jgi:hypothetical protein